MAAAVVDDGYPVEIRCRVLGASVSSYFCWRRRVPSPRAARHAMLLEVICQIRHVSRRIYGARRIHAELISRRGISVARRTVERVGRNGLAGLPDRPRCRKVPNQPTATDLVNRQLGRVWPDQLWATYTTNHRIPEGKVFRAAVLNVFSRRAVGWSIDAQPHTSRQPMRSLWPSRTRDPSGRRSMPIAAHSPSAGR